MSVGEFGLRAAGEVISGLDFSSFFTGRLVFDLAFFLMCQVFIAAFLASHAEIAANGIYRILRSRWMSSLVSILMITLVIVLLNSHIFPLSYFSLGIGSSDVIVSLVLIFSSFFVFFYILGASESGRAKVFSSLILLLLYVSPLIKSRIDVLDREMTVPGGGEKNIIIIGIDGLRSDRLSIEGALPNIASLIADGAIYYGNSYTTVARTYVAWSSLLTAKYPLTSGIRFNLQNISGEMKGEFLTWELKEEGYKTLWAIDERRFNSIDESYGFDMVVAPRSGAAEFLISQISDTPFINLFSIGPWGEIIFPYLQNNRGAFKTYNPFSMVDSVVNAMPAGEKVFAAIHLCLPHYPYLSNFMERPNDMSAGLSRANYESMLTLVDRQFSVLLDELAKKGFLNNAVLYVISDHGEAFPGEAEITPGNPYARFPINIPGHGTSVAMDAQNKIVMVKASFENGKVVRSNKGVHNGQLRSIVDVGADFAKEAGVDVSGIDGVSFSEEVDERYIYLESSYSVGALSRDRIDAVQVLAEGASAYEVLEDGRLYFRSDVFPAMAAAKQRAVLSSEGIMLAMYPDEKEFLIAVDKGEQKWWPVSPKRYMGESFDWEGSLSELCRFLGEDAYVERSDFCE